MRDLIQFNAITPVYTITTVESGGSVVTTNYGTGPETKDGDVDTYYGRYVDQGGDNHCQVLTQVDYTWDVARKIDSIYAKIGTKAQPCGNYKSGWRYGYVYLKMSGIWTLVYSSGNLGYAPGNDSTTTEFAYYTDVVTELATGWSNVTGMRAVGHAFCTSYEGNRRQQVGCRVAEMKAFVKTRNYNIGVS